MRTAAVSFLAAAVLWAQPPATRSGGVVNAASRVPSVLPGGAIARGALFDIAGVRLGTSAQTCPPPPILPVAVWQGRTAGLVVLSRTISEPNAIADESVGVFASHEDRDPVLSPVLLIPPLGTCTTYTTAMGSGPQPAASLADALMSSAEVNGLNAGPRLTVARNRLRLPISPLPGAGGVYKRLLGEKRTDRPGRGGPLFLDPGNLVVAGSGGADIGPFAVSVPAPEPFLWENRDSLAAVDRRAGVTLRWHQAAAEGAVLIGLVSVDQTGLAWGACYCAAGGAAGSFIIPSEILANLPASQAAPGVPSPAVWLSYLPIRNQQPLHASGLDNGLAVSLFVETREVQVR